VTQRSPSISIEAFGGHPDRGGFGPAIFRIIFHVVFNTYLQVASEM
jgi:hypothetical protein